MAKKANPTLRNLWADGLLSTLGAGHLIIFYNGTQPATTATALSGNTALATLTADATPSTGAAAAGVVGFDTATYTQNNATHAAGIAPTWMSLQTSGGVRVYEVSTTGDGLTFTGVIQTGVDVARTAWTWTAPDA